MVIAALRKLCKKNNMIKPTKAMAIIKSWITLSAAFNVNSEESLATRILIFCAA
ncbi:hypothetical protein D3C73_1017290 [compost metagenome]